MGSGHFVGWSARPTPRLVVRQTSSCVSSHAPIIGQGLWSVDDGPVTQPCPSKRWYVSLRSIIPMTTSVIWSIVSSSRKFCRPSNPRFADVVSEVPRALVRGYGTGTRFGAREGGFSVSGHSGVGGLINRRARGALGGGVSKRNVETEMGVDLKVTEVATGHIVVADSVSSSVKQGSSISVGEFFVDPDKGEVLGAEETEIGVIEVTRAEPRFSPLCQRT